MFLWVVDGHAECQCRRAKCAVRHDECAGLYVNWSQRLEPQTRGRELHGIESPQSPNDERFVKKKPRGLTTDLVGHFDDHEVADVCQETSISRVSISCCQVAGEGSSTER